MVEYSSDGIYGDIQYGSPHISKGLKLAMAVCSGGMPGITVFNCKVLVVGAGNGYELVYYGKSGNDVTGIDLYVPDVPYVKERTIQGDASSMPFKDQEFDFVHCTEMIEHIPYEMAIEVLKEIQRVGHYYLISIASNQCPWDSHINIRKPYHWMEVMEDMGYKFANAQYNPFFFIQNGKYITKISYNEGFLAHGLCNYNQ